MTPHINFIPINIAIVTISDSRMLDNDKSGDILEERVLKSNHKIISRDIVKDDFTDINKLFLNLINNVYELYHYHQYNIQHHQNDLMKNDESKMNTIARLEAASKGPTIPDVKNLNQIAFTRANKTLCKLCGCKG